MREWEVALKVELPAQPEATPEVVMAKMLRTAAELLQRWAATEVGVMAVAREVLHS